MPDMSQFPWRRILIWALVLGVPVSLVADWGEWDRLPVNTLLRVLIAAAGGLAGWVLNVLFGNYVGMGTNVIESMGIFRFSSDAHQKIENGFIFFVALVGAVIAMLAVH
jgi:hypothetical protein